MSRNPGRSYGARCANAAALSAALVATSILVPFTAATQVIKGAAIQTPANGPSTGSASGPLPVRLQVTLKLSALHPAATKGALECGAVARTRDWVDSHRDSLTDYDSVTHWVLTPAHYYGERAILEFPITNRAYMGTQIFTTTLSPQALTDPATRARFAPNPTVLVACWLSINGRPAVWDQGSALQVISSWNVASVNSKPLVIGVADAGAAVSVAGQLSGQGLFFNPGPVNVVASLPSTGSGVVASAGTVGGVPQINGPIAKGAPVTAAISPLTPSSSVPSLGALAPVSTAPSSLAAKTPTPPVPSLGTQVPANARANAPPPVSSRVVTSVPAVSGLNVSPRVYDSHSPKATVVHRVQWDCAQDEAACGGNGVGASTYSYEVWTRDPSATSFSQVSLQAAPFQYVDCSNPTTGCVTDKNHLITDFYAFVVPQTTVRLIRKDPTGGHTQAFADFVYASPPQPQQPADFTATEPQFGQVLLNWKAVVNGDAYRVSEKGGTAPAQRVPYSSPDSYTITWNSVPAGSHTYQLATEYAAGLVAPNPTEASVVVHAPLPARSVAYLTKNNGPGNHDATLLHLSTTVGDTLAGLAAWFGLVTGTDSQGNPTFSSQPAKAFYANVTELGSGRDVTCWQWPNKITTFVTAGEITFCLAGSHRLAAALPDGPALAAMTGAQPSSYSVIVSSPTMGQYFAILRPWNPCNSWDANCGSPSWGEDWITDESTTFDGEGPKYAPHACLTCHGGTFNPTTGKVTGASLLPIDPGMVVFDTTPGRDRAGQEEGIRQINAMIAASNPSAAILDYINGLYSGKATTPGSVAQANYVPAAWSQQAELFQTVVKPDCLMCHLATPAARSFGSAANFIQNKAAIYADVCTVHSMPNAQVPYQNFWTSNATIGTTTINLAGYMLAILGYTSCP